MKFLVRLTKTNFNRSLDDFAYDHARRPAIQTEDVSGIKKLGFRSILDKKSDEVRKELTTTFTSLHTDIYGAVPAETGLHYLAARIATKYLVANFADAAPKFQVPLIISAGLLIPP